MDNIFSAIAVSLVLASIIMLISNYYYNKKDKITDLKVKELEKYHTIIFKKYIISRETGCKIIQEIIYNEVIKIRKEIQNVQTGRFR